MVLSKTIQNKLMAKYGVKNPLKEKTLYKGWQPVNDELDDSGDESRIHVESLAVAISIKPVQSAEAWINLLCSLQALSMTYQTAHWKSSGETFYGDHLMFQRLYDNVSKEIDSVAEKMIGVTSDASQLDPATLLATSARLVKQLVTPGEPATMMLAAEKKFVALLEQIKSIFDSQGQYTDGVENLVQGIADTHEENVYLLSRRVGSEGVQMRM